MGLNVISRIIPNAWKNISIPRSEYEPNHRLSSLISVTRIRSLTLSLPQNHDSDHLPLYRVNATEMEKLDYPPKTPLNLSPKIVYLTLAALGYPTMSTTSENQPSILGPALVIAFAGSLSVMFLKGSHPRLASIVATIGYLSFALSFLDLRKVQNFE
ncbi:hypothetical protein CR513_57928, partial [Mucuna pruriens]